MKQWWPLAISLAIIGSFALWEAMDDYERARYFGMIATLPITVFAIWGIMTLGKQ